MDIAITAEDTRTPSAGRWPFWTTLGWAILILIVSQLIIPGLVIAVFAAIDVHAAKGLGDTSSEYFGQMVVREITRGDVVWLTIVVSDLTGLGAILGIVLIKRQEIRSYLSLSLVPWNRLLKWLGILAVFLILTQGGAYLFGLDFGAEFMKQQFDATRRMWLLWITMVLAAPLFEEIFFRGFLFRGFQASVLGTPGTVVLTAILWGAVHVQYNLYGMGLIAGAGVLYGIARAQTGSVIVTLLLHSATNFANMVEYLIGRASGGS